MSKLTILEPKTLTEAMEFATVLSKSGMVPDHYQGKPSNVLVAIQWGYELGLAPMQALQNISVIQGKPSIWGDAMLALVKAHPAFRGMHEQLEGDTAICEVKREMENGEIETTVGSFSIAEANKAGLTNKRGPWQTYPNRMLKLRARGFALRDAFPDAIKGLITTEEARDYPDEGKNPSEKAVQAPNVVSGGDTVQNLVEALTEQPSAIDEVKPLKALPLAIPNRDTEEYQLQEDWANRYGELMLAMRGADKLSPADRRTKLKELEQLNLEVLDQLDDELGTELKEKRLSYNKQLSMDAKKEGNDDQSWPNS